ncbi:MAG: glycosyltransferase [Anaerolineaceae bacterium]|nr:glycosyltransferase [Anaerolineaceae bacterium]
MKILYLVHQFYPEFQTGTEKFVYNCAFMGQKFGNKVKVITYSFYDDSFYDREENYILSKEILYQGIPILVFKLKKQPSDINISLESTNLYEIAKRIIEDEQPDIVHIGHLMRMSDFIQVIEEKKIPYIITLTDFFLICPKVILAPNRYSLCSGPQKGTACANLCKEFSGDFIKSRLKKAKNILINAKYVTCPSNFVARIITQEYENLKIVTINHGIRYKHILENKRNYVDQDQITFGYAGSLLFHKGVQVLIESFKKIHNEYAKLVIYGSGKEDFVNKLKEIVGNDERISFCGSYNEEQLGRIFQEIDVLIIPSICYESYSLVMHEALASNVPVITSNLGGMAERITDGVNGYIFKAANSSELKNKMNLIVENPSILNKLKINIKTNMIIPTVEQEAYQYFKLYNNIINGQNTIFDSSE